MVQHKTGPWKLSELVDVEKNGLNVFSAFHCGGGSTMGYKLAGFNVLGGIEIDPEMMSIYRANHNPKHSFLMGVQDFNKLSRDKIPKELFDLDILDGSPPCSSFSMAGSREKQWGNKKKFREGQAEQVLDDLFFDFIETARILQPKVVIAENVKGLVQGKARGYVKQIFQMFRYAGYETQLFLLDASSMGVPQKRERTFFIAKRTNFSSKKILLSFNEKSISLKTAFEKNMTISKYKSLTESSIELWHKCKQGETFATVHPNGSRWNWSREDINKPCRTFASTSSNMICHPLEPRPFTDLEKCRIQTFPDDYNFLKQDAGYVCGMSVPPYMMQRIALSVKNQLFGESKAD